MKWNNLTDIQQLETIKEESVSQPVAIFKHSTRCSISSMALSRFEKEWNENTNVELYFLDLLAHRTISDLIAQRSGVQHQSPQVIVFIDGEVIHHSSHNGISAELIESIIHNLTQ